MWGEYFYLNRLKSSIGPLTRHRRGHQQFDLALLLLHGLLEVLEEQSLHVAHDLPQEGQRG